MMQIEPLLFYKGVLWLFDKGEVEAVVFGEGGGDDEVFVHGDGAIICATATAVPTPEGKAFLSNGR